MKKILSLFILLACCAMSFAQSSFNPDDLLKGPPSPQKLVNDYGNILTADQAGVLESKLTAFDDSSSTQVAVVIIPNLGNYDVSDYGVKLGRAWGIGGKQFSNGVLLLISVADRKVNISTGYGVEGALPDITTSHIIQEVIVPNFKGNDYYRGIDEGTDAIISAVRGEYKTPREKKSSGGAGVIPIIIIIIIIIALSSGGGRGGSFMSSRGAIPFIIGNMIGNSGGGSSNWGGGGGSGGGGGFGGFGGGSFGGGGSSGSW